MYIALFSFILFPAALVWFLICNARTYRNRGRLIEATSKLNRESLYTKNWWNEYEKTSYDKHLWHLLTFRDPWKRYATELVSASRGAK